MLLLFPFQNVIQLNYFSEKREFHISLSIAEELLQLLQIYHLRFKNVIDTPVSLLAAV